MHWKEVSVSVTGLLMPLSVSVPSTDETLSPSKFTLDVLAFNSQFLYIL